MKLVKFITIVFLGCLTLAFLLVTLVNAAEIRVPEDYSTISAAVSSAAPGDTILIEPGTYEENVEIIVPRISIQSTDGAEVTVIKGEFKILTDGVTISGFTITSPGNGIVIENASNVTITSNTISGNHEDGILLTGDCSDILIEDNQISDNWDAGIDLLSSGNNYTIRGNNISGNWIGIRIGEDAGGVLIEENVIENNEYANIHPM